MLFENYGQEVVGDPRSLQLLRLWDEACTTWRIKLIGPWKSRSMLNWICLKCIWNIRLRANNTCLDIRQVHSITALELEVVINDNKNWLLQTTSIHS